LLANYHTHSVFCDGNSSLSEIVLFAIDNKFDALGFSGHGYTPFDISYCMKDTDRYIDAVYKLKEQYKEKIQIYLGVEEDMFSPAERNNFDYIIGSCHYLLKDGKYYAIDSDADGFKKCLDLFGGDIISLSHYYYKTFCDYIRQRKPDIVGHFDLITKYDEVLDIGFKENSDYIKLSNEYIIDALKNDVLFEVNTGAISRGYKKDPYPDDELLHTIKKYDGKVVLSSDSHSANTLDFYFNEAKKHLRDIGFECVYVLCDGEWKKDYI
jgi:histidinol-phosphatase (PHP family)